VTTSGINQIRMRGAGGTTIYSDGLMTLGVELPPNATAWIAASDSMKKQNIRLVDTEEILDKVSQLPIKQWSYKNADPSIEHIGPMAQDFWKLFHLGEDSLGISTIDPDGIALAAIKELKVRTDEIEILKTENEAMRARLDKLEALMQNLLVSRDRNGIKQTKYLNKNITQ
jgi:hypothetical protein